MDTVTFNGLLAAAELRLNRIEVYDNDSVVVLNKDVTIIDDTLYTGGL